MPEKPIPEQDPITGKSYAIHYLIATVILIGTLFWALYDEAWGQRPWKAFQDQWKDRYSAFLNTATVEVGQVRAIGRAGSAVRRAEAGLREGLSGFQGARRRGPQEARRRQRAAARGAECLHRPPRLRERTHLRIGNQHQRFGESQQAKGNRRLQSRDKRRSNFPTAARRDFTFPRNWRRTYNEIRDERTKLSLELGDVLKPVTAAKAKMDEYISDHMVDLTPQQIQGLKRRATEWDPAIVQINVADANIVDRCESCHMNTREPLKITAAAMTAKGREEAGRIRQRVRQPSRAGVAVDSRSREVWLLALPPGQRPRHHQRREGARKLRALAVAALSQRKFAGRLPELPRCRHGAGQRRRAVATPSTTARICSGSAAAWAAIAMRATTKSPKI